mmetsp:Transcript_5053/g.11981  ORF Transcript_5053/g.11981 Transcript_5053/m.11981 type:complete len:106 (-) Transcript_5053:544-861(-)
MTLFFHGPGFSIEKLKNIFVCSLLVFCVRSWQPLSNLDMSTSCSGLIAKYAECMRASDCMKVEHKSLKECMASRPEECEQFRYALFHCRKGQVDARTRIQGNKGY